MVICDVEINHSQINTLLQMSLLFIFHSSPSKMKWAINQRQSIQGPMFTWIFHCLCIQNKFLSSAMYFRNTMLITG